MLGVKPWPWFYTSIVEIFVSNNYIWELFNERVSIIKLDIGNCIRVSCENLLQFIVHTRTVNREQWSVPPTETRMYCAVLSNSICMSYASDLFAQFNWNATLYKTIITSRMNQCTLLVFPYHTHNSILASAVIAIAQTVQWLDMICQEKLAYEIDTW